MKFLAVDIGTGTQDIYLFQSGLAIENGFKFVVPSPTMLVFRRIREATAKRGRSGFERPDNGGRTQPLGGPGSSKSRI